MNTSMLESCVDLPLQEEVLKDISDKAKDWAIMHGISMRSKTNFNCDAVQFIPFVLLPTVYKVKDFKQVVNVQTILNELVHRVAHNKAFLTQCLRDTILVDEFTRKLFQIYETIEKEGVSQKVHLGLLRSDYMYHSKSNSLKQVELNTIASSLGAVASQISNLNRYVLRELNQHEKLKCIPKNHALIGLSEGILDVWKIYGKENAVILFIVEEVTYNISDQRFLEFEICKINSKVKVIRRTLNEISKRAALLNNKELLIDNFEVAVIYFRAGYEPGHYPTQKEWDARLLMERSKAIKCPSIQYHLTGTKKVQQELTKPGILEIFLNESSDLKAIRELFVGLYGLDFDELGQQAVQMSLEEPSKYVLKPQREGGGNNIYGTKVKETMLKIKDSKERTAWILMERITPPTFKGYMIKPGMNVYSVDNLISELGIFGVIIGDENKIFVNKQVGHMLRTKSSTVDEGGVAAGVGAMDCPFLID